jgi:beta-glucosidase/6-phospho-beta-glucosidase/beta-galactosidase
MRRAFAGLALLATAISFACSSDPAPAPENLELPKSFLFGTAIAGFQVDMGCPSNIAGCNDPNSDWYTWVTKPELVADKGTFIHGDPISAGPGFYELYPQDLDRVKNELHNGALRLSIEWSRIFPTATDGIDDPTALKAAASPDGLAFYHAVFAAMKARGIRPLVTLNHYTLPTWLHDAYGCHVDIANCKDRGWLDHDRILKEIAKYAGFCAKEFGGEVDDWATLNEPFTAVVVAGFLLPTESRTNPPGVQLKIPEAKAAGNTMMEAHAKMYDAVKANDTVAAWGGAPARVGLVYNIEPTEPSDPTDPIDVDAAKNLSYLLNDVFLAATVKGDVDVNLDGKTVHRDDMAGRMDFIGINYYARIVSKAAAAPFPTLSPLLAVSIASFTSPDYAYPKGIYQSIKLVQKWGLPMIITETGTDNALGNDPSSPWIVRTLTWVKRAIAEGADVQGYFYWTLMDNYEWNHGMTFKMGMYAVDPNDATKKRTARPQVDVYARIAQAGKIPDDLAAKYPAPR